MVLKERKEVLRVVIDEFLEGFGSGSYEVLVDKITNVVQSSEEFDKLTSRRPGVS